MTPQSCHGFACSCQSRQEPTAKRAALKRLKANKYRQNVQDKAAFEANPAKFVPQHGGFCSYGVSVGQKFDGDPEKFVVHEGKLFLFLNDKTRELFLEDVAGIKATADENWEDIKHKSVQELANS